ncbi:hypothetical protein [Streptomyces sp. NRRL S-378]|uniref:hypothetical protein n=1 Tax=Streptomyces sp. NRRL S-378 TaxID=1463904 RepID=UPI0004CA443D|nr:hypothetical protein [Streptomyces sp. NRRL S-378]
MHVIKRTVLDFRSRRVAFGSVEVVTRDIGATIGTVLLCDGVRIAAYRPGTRYGDVAEDAAAKHLAGALKRIDAAAWLPGEHLTDLLATHLRAILDEDKCAPWDPSENDEEEDDQWV